MMQDIDQAIELYKLMAKRCLDSGFAPYQGQVYTEMSDFMSDCTSAEEAMMKIKNSKYYLAPSVALMKDKLTALKNAALSHSMPIVADIYQHKLNEIDQNPAAIYETGYEKDAQNQKLGLVNSTV